MIFAKRLVYFIIIIVSVFSFSGCGREDKWETKAAVETNGGESDSKDKTENAKLDNTTQAEETGSVQTGKEQTIESSTKKQTDEADNAGKTLAQYLDYIKAGNYDSAGDLLWGESVQEFTYNSKADAINKMKRIDEKVSFEMLEYEITGVSLLDEKLYDTSQVKIYKCNYNMKFYQNGKLADNNFTKLVASTDTEGLKLSYENYYAVKRFDFKESRIQFPEKTNTSMPPMVKIMTPKCLYCLSGAYFYLDIKVADNAYAYEGIKTSYKEDKPTNLVIETGERKIIGTLEKRGIRGFNRGSNFLWVYIPDLANNTDINKISLTGLCYDHTWGYDSGPTFSDYLIYENGNYLNQQLINNYR